MTITICSVCEEELSGPNMATCLACQRDFHLQMRVDFAGKDCGEVWLHDARMHLMFGCSQCIEAGRFAAAPDAEEF